jgi:phenylpropionate dioxygenase-like ring-hydroxylating dioxygenase large terminal subunit
MMSEPLRETRGAADLVRADQVHRDLYLSPAIFELERQRLFRRVWLFVGHDSQIPSAGDFVTCDLAGEPVLMLRREDASIALLHNRCAHKGVPLASSPSGRIARVLRCPYHGWTYATDGHLIGMPLREGYDGTTFAQSDAARGLTHWGEVAVHRGFVFARAESDGKSFAESMGELLLAIDLIADRSPSGRLRIAGGVFRTEFRANWKVYLENINDSVHPVTTHASATLSARTVWGSPPADAVPPLAIRQLLPFGSGYQFFERMGARILPGGHSVLGTQQSLHTSYTALGDYGEALRAAHGEARAAQVLAFSPQNVVCYPTMAIKGAPQVMRVLRPLAHDRTVVEAWAFQPEGAPDALLESALLYNRQVFSPLSLVAHDDLHLFERIQHSLAAGPNAWVSLHREARGEPSVGARDVGGVDEALLRNQYAAWAKLMAEPVAAAGDRAS